jgi:DMSO/TMAO reductase YedYZ molybdopterin-dependent catalytic subunit
MRSLTRRSLIAGAGAGAALTLPALAQRMVDLGLPGGPSARPMGPRFPQKRDMIVQRVHPPLLETPFAVFDRSLLTPNDQHFVRWHWDFPTSIDVERYRVAVYGAVESPLTLSLDQVLRAGKHVEFNAVNQCAGNGRGLFEPRIAGAQWGPGAMANATWRGVRLRDVLDKAGVRSTARFVRFKGLDRPPIDGAPQFIKSIPIDIARRDDTIVAFAMNGTTLPLLNGFPLRIVVPGWYSTYWVKMLSDIEVLTAEDQNFWMAKAYRMPVRPVKPGDKGFATKPISTMVPRAWITSHSDGARIPKSVSGIAMGGDSAVRKVDLIVQDNDGHVVEAQLGPDEGQYGFRRWSAQLPELYGNSRIGPQCTNANGVTQPLIHSWNPNGYARDGVEFINLKIT